MFCFLGLLFGLWIYMNLKKLPVHRAMREISELIYETCKTYLITQGKFILILEVFIAASSSFFTSACCSGWSRFASVDHSAFQSGRHRRQLRRRLVWHSR